MCCKPFFWLKTPRVEPPLEHVMRFAAAICSGRVVDAGEIGAARRQALCFACGGAVHSLNGLWIHDDLESSGRCRMVSTPAITPTDGSIHLESKVDTGSQLCTVRYSPDSLGGAASLYLSSADKPPPGWRFATWAPHPTAFSFRLNGEIHTLRVIMGDEGVGGVVANECSTKTLFPIDEEGRRTLQRFHRTGLIHVDPASLGGAFQWRAVRAPPGGGKTTLLMDLAAAWPTHRFLLVTFARDIAEELRQRATQRGISNLVVKTVDALCYAAEFDVAGSTGDVIFQLGDKDLVEAAYPRCRPWFKKKGGANLGPLVEHVLRHLPVGDSMEGLLCAKHEPFRWIIEELAAPVATKAGLCHLRRSFSSMRGRAGRTSAAVMRLRQLPAVASADVLLVDEAQDLTQQALQILKCLAKPTLAVGDPRQSVYDYVDCRVCPDCLDLIEAVERRSMSGQIHGFAGAEEAATLDLYETHRLDALSCQVMEEWTGGRLAMVSAKCPAGEPLIDPPIRSVPRVPPDPEPILRLVRSNREVVEAVRSDTSLGVVGGASLARELRHHSKVRAKAGKQRGGRDRVTAMEALANDLVGKGVLEATCIQLEERDSPLSMASQGGRVVSSVHRSKGAEAPHVVVDRDLILPRSRVDTDGDFCISVVAGTRHTKLLSVISKATEEGLEAGQCGTKRARG